MRACKCVDSLTEAGRFGRLSRLAQLAQGVQHARTQILSAGCGDNRQRTHECAPRLCAVADLLVNARQFMIQVDVIELVKLDVRIERLGISRQIIAARGWRQHFGSLGQVLQRVKDGLAGIGIIAACGHHRQRPH